MCLAVVFVVVVAVVVVVVVTAVVVVTVVLVEVVGILLVQPKRHKNQIIYFYKDKKVKTTLQRYP